MNGLIPPAPDGIQSVQSANVSDAIESIDLAIDLVGLLAMGYDQEGTMPPAVTSMALSNLHGALMFLRAHKAQYDQDDLPF